MAKKIAKIAMLIIIIAGIAISIFNFIALKSEAKTVWQKLEMGTDPETGGIYVRCFETGQACLTVYPFED